MNSVRQNVPKMLAPPAKGGYETLLYIFGLFVVIFIIIFVYYKTIGYTISFGWDKVLFLFEKKQPIDISVTEDGEVAATTTLVPAISDSPPGNANAQLPFSPEERPSGMPGAQQTPALVTGTISNIESDLFGTDNSGSSSGSSSSTCSGGVFNVSRNIYKYEDAAPLCKAMGAELATYDQVLQAFKKGGDWCNYGWVKGQMAVYPTQEKTWQKLQSGPPEYRFACGKPGVNGGYFDNPDLTFGVNCFGTRPLQNDADDLQNSPEFTMPQTVEQIEFDKRVQKFREGLGNVTVMPFSRGKWSQ